MKRTHQIYYIVGWASKQISLTEADSLFIYSLVLDREGILCNQSNTSF
jgi:hypothetical protein